MTELSSQTHMRLMCIEMMPLSRHQAATGGMHMHNTDDGLMLVRPAPCLANGLLRALSFGLMSTRRIVQNNP